MEYYPTMRKKEKILLFGTVWTDLEDTMLSEMSAMKNKYVYDNTYLWNFKKLNLWR